MHGFVLAVFRARARARARARSKMRLYQSILVNALLGREFGGSNGSRIDAMHAKRSITSTRGSCGRVGQRATESILVQLACWSPDISAMGGDIPDDGRVGA